MHNKMGTTKEEEKQEQEFFFIKFSKNKKITWYTTASKLATATNNRLFCARYKNAGTCVCVCVCGGVGAC